MTSRQCIFCQSDLKNGKQSPGTLLATKYGAKMFGACMIPSCQHQYREFYDADWNVVSSSVWHYDYEHSNEGHWYLEFFPDKTEVVYHDGDDSHQSEIRVIEKRHNPLEYMELIDRAKRLWAFK